ncbi:efflux RND transporter permease subunit [Myxococcus llanfairpwllgwyngyllgogerychwyrndrobwllllantysiliogogogochensis]|uniref:Efflux RND transporter permease subunit n=1 Tax=Myxococcus llanfairpwllgwyngyllgogerychwyrndrobwllllantysiliogogogochensis TaxID=2590453 RepID=A0A540WX64_9BACT|nr:efflux RND transporter permease subunit [Myxococcus llanfairpwllgwyngyllgogerychwyrndrobwllllantysiliogogogochensis]TQF13593.1 efflux RND transporter permease subunit [Myxococcus llanfairpwllgwyngyllgogerychwyrndrobwllllantysiliogogogochensis]
MLDHVILFSLRHRLFVVLAAVAVLLYGGWAVTRLPVDVFPDLNRPTVTVMTEAGGLSPEEVETLITTPIETAMNGAPGVQRVRSSSGVGLSIVYVEFDWGTDIYLDRQLVSERLQVASERLPRDVAPHLTPVSSIMGEILLLGVQSEEGRTSPLELRSLADWVLRQRLLTIPGIAQVTVLGGGVKQFQVRVAPEKLLAFGLTFEDVERAAGLSQGNTTGGFVDQGGREYLVRNLARSASVEDLRGTVVAVREGVPVRLSQVAEVDVGPAVKRGDGGMNGRPAVILAVQKQPGASTLALTEQVDAAVKDLRLTLPDDVRVETLFRQADFIQAAVGNVVEALRDGALLVVVVLFLFLVNLRTTAITLTAIPLSFVITALVMNAFGLSINTLTLGGLAVAVGELVDDAIVDVENVYRRLRENRAKDTPEPALRVIYRASAEVRGSIVFATLIVVLVFLPLFALGGIEGRLFAPLGVAYVVSILASLLVSLTVTPAMCAYLLPRGRLLEHGDGALVRWLKARARRVLDVALGHPKPVLVGATLLVLAAVAVVPFLGRSFLPPFNEGTATVNVLAPPGTSLEESNRFGLLAERLIASVPEVKTVGRRTGRAEQDEHAEGVHYSELDVDFKEGGRPRDVVLADLRERLAVLPGLSVSVGQPISHRLDHLLSGIRAQVAVKLFGQDLDALRGKAEEVRAVMAQVPGVVDLQVEQQTLIPQLQVRLKREESARLGVQPGAMAEQLEKAFNGVVVGQVLEGQRTFDVLVRYEERARVDAEAFRRALVDTPSGARVPVAAIADVVESRGPNVIHHDHLQRRVVIMANVAGRDLGSAVEEVRERVAASVTLPTGTFLSYEGQFESQQSATRLIALLSLLSLAGMFLVLYAHFRSVRLVAQVMLNIPLALVGSVTAVVLTGQPLSVATLVGFVTLCGIASRNTIMLISHYLHLVEQEGEVFSRELVLRGSLERLVPVLMTALTAGLALVPLALASGAPGKEILHPVATVILGGLISSTLLDLLVTPAVFYRFGRPALERYLARKAAARAEDDLTLPGPKPEGERLASAG